jgi:hypothetical protein
LTIALDAHAGRHDAIASLDLAKQFDAAIATHAQTHRNPPSHVALDPVNDETVAQRDDRLLGNQQRIGAVAHNDPDAGEHAGTQAALGVRKLGTHFQ